MKGQSAFIVIIPLFLSMVALTVKYNANHAQIKRKWRCNQYGHSIQIWDDSVTPSGATIESINDSDFKLFVESISTYLGQKLPLANACQTGGKHASEINLIFVRLPLVTSGESPLAPPPKLSSPGHADACRLESPWVNFYIRHGELPRAEAIFIWSERQFLVDQYLYSHPHSKAPSALMPFLPSVFYHYASDYSAAKFLRTQPHQPSQTTNKGDTPADLYWLFKESPQVSFMPFSEAARVMMKTKISDARSKHISMITYLIDNCLRSTRRSFYYYSTILELQTGLININ